MKVTLESKTRTKTGAVLGGKKGGKRTGTVTRTRTGTRTRFNKLTKIGTSKIFRTGYSHNSDNERDRDKIGVVTWKLKRKWTVTGIGSSI